MSTLRTINCGKIKALVSKIRSELQKRLILLYITGSCKNLHDDKKCGLWARDRECMRNSGWMLKNCAKSCNSCEMLVDEDRDNDDNNNDDVDDDDDHRNEHDDDVDDRNDNIDDNDDNGTIENNFLNID